MSLPTAECWVETGDLIILAGCRCMQHLATYDVRRTMYGIQFVGKTENRYIEPMRNSAQRSYLNAICYLIYYWILGVLTCKTMTWWIIEIFADDFEPSHARRSSSAFVKEVDNPVYERLINRHNCFTRMDTYRPLILVQRSRHIEQSEKKIQAFIESCLL